MNHYEKILHTYSDSFDTLESYFEWHSRIIKKIPKYNNLLLMKLKPTIFSYQDALAIPLEGIDRERTILNDFFSKRLHDRWIKTSTLATKNEIILIKKDEVPPIEVVVKWAFIWSPKHLYVWIDTFITRAWNRLHIWEVHPAYVRFDYRNMLPKEDCCMPEWLADYFINTKNAKKTALKTFWILKEILETKEFTLLDVCFFMNVTGTVITAEISTDNTKIVYIWNDESIRKIFTDKDKQNALKRAKLLNTLLLS